MKKNEKKYSGGFTFVEFVLLASFVGLMTMLVFLVLGFDTESIKKDQCISFQKKVQVNVRSFQDKKNLNPGDKIDWSRIGMDIGQRCPSGGRYVFSDFIPSIGFPACQCEYPCPGSTHHPITTEGW